MKRREAALFAALLLLSESSGIRKLFVPVERGFRGTAVIGSPTVSSPAICAAACAAVSACRGFNWKPSPPACDIISSLRSIEAASDYAIYVEEFPRTARHLSFPCDTCMGDPPVGMDYWTLDCPEGGVAVGVASVTALTDLDYLLCSQLPGVTINLAGGGYIADDRICSQVIDAPFPVTALWSSQQDFAPPTNLRYQCRRVTSGQQIDLERCEVPLPLEGAIPGVPGAGHQVLLCPPHMVAASFFWDSADQFLKLTCCLLY